MSKVALLSLAGAALALAAPALAARPDTPTAAGTTAQDGARAAPATPAPERRYCVDEESTGSRITQRTCLTRKVWLERGFDPLAK